MTASEGEMTRPEQVAVLVLSLLLAVGVIAYGVIAAASVQPRLVALLALMVAVAAGLAAFEFRYLIKRRRLSGKSYARYDQALPVALATFAVNYGLLFLLFSA